MRFTFAMVCLCLLTSLAGFEPTSGAEPPRTAVAFVPDGSAVVTTSQRGVEVLSWPQLKRLRRLPSTAANLHAIAFAPAGKLLAVAGGDPAQRGTVEVFTWPSGEPVARFSGHQDSVLDIVWSNDRSLWSASLDREIKRWDLADAPDTEASPLADDSQPASITLRGHSRSVEALCMIPATATLVSGGVDQSVRVWDISNEKMVRSLRQHTQGIRSLALRPNREGLPMIASAAADRTIRFWQPTIGRMVRYVRLDEEPLRIAWLHDGVHIAAACVDGKVRIIDADNVQVTRTIDVLDGWAYALAVHPSDGTMAVGGSDGQIRRVGLEVDRE